MQYSSNNMEEKAQLAALLSQAIGRNVDEREVQYEKNGEKVDTLIYRPARTPWGTNNNLHWSYTVVNVGSKAIRETADIVRYLGAMLTNPALGVSTGTDLIAVLR